MYGMFCTRISVVEEDKKCIESSQKGEIQSFCKKGGVTGNINSLVPMDRVQMSLGCQLLNPKQFLLLI